MQQVNTQPENQRYFPTAIQIAKMVDTLSTRLHLSLRQEDQVHQIYFRFFDQVKKARKERQDISKLSLARKDQISKLLTQEQRQLFKLFMIEEKKRYLRQTKALERLLAILNRNKLYEDVHQE